MTSCTYACAYTHKHYNIASKSAYTNAPVGSYALSSLDSFKPEPGIRMGCTWHQNGTYTHPTTYLDTVYTSPALSQEASSTSERKSRHL